MSYQILNGIQQYNNPKFSTQQSPIRYKYIVYRNPKRICNLKYIIPCQHFSPLQFPPYVQCQQQYSLVIPQQKPQYYIPCNQNHQTRKLQNQKLQVNQVVQIKVNLKKEQEEIKYSKNQLPNENKKPVVLVEGPSILEQNPFRKKNEKKQLDPKIDRQNAPVSLILGKNGVGKTSIMKKLFDNRKIIEFQPEYLPELNSYFVDTRAFDFDSEVNKREEQINLYQQLFQAFPDKVSNIFIVVNFERTDSMKDKIMAVYTKFRKFMDRVSIIITDFQRSEDPQHDEQHLRESLSFFKVQGIVFTGYNMSRDKLIEKLRNVMKQNDQHIYPFDLKGTQFEIMNPEEMDNLMEEFKKGLIKKE